MSKTDWYNDSDGSRVEIWSIERDGYRFHCSYRSKTDFVEVVCHGIEHFPKKALGKGSREVIANILAGEILREHKNYSDKVSTGVTG